MKWPSCVGFMDPRSKSAHGTSSLLVQRHNDGPILAFPCACLHGPRIALTHTCMERLNMEEHDPLVQMPCHTTHAQVLA